jgi:N-acetylated-alpha-linked acidic dipeptidase
MAAWMWRLVVRTGSLTKRQGMSPACLKPQREAGTGSFTATHSPSTANSRLHDSLINSHYSLFQPGTPVRAEMAVTCRKQRIGLLPARYTFGGLPTSSRREKIFRLAAIFLAASCILFLATPGRAQDPASIPGFAPARVPAERQLEQDFRSIPDAAHAESDLRHLTSEPHMAGTEASHRVAEWLRDQYRSFGFDAEIVAYNVWLPQPREIKLELTKPAHRPLASPEPPIDGDKESFDTRAVAGFNAYSPSGEVTAPVVYVNYGMPEDYRDLAHLGVSVEGKIAIARYGKGYRGIKAKLAEEHKAAGLVLYSDPQDDGYAAGDAYPRGPWRPMSGIQRGSIVYTQIYPGDPLTPGVASTPDAKRLPPADAPALPHIPAMPISARDAAVILSSLGGRHVPRGWQGALPFTYHVGPGDAQVHMKLVMDYAERPIYDVIAKLHGTLDDEWVVLGNHHDAWVFGAADPGSGTAAMLETGRALGELARSGWKPRRTIVICAWDGEEPGLLGSTAWVEQNRAELQAKAVAYINTDVGVSGPNFSASATPSLKELVRDVTRDVPDPDTGLRVYDAWREHTISTREELSGTARQSPRAEISGKAPVGALGAGSDFCPFFDYAGIPSVDIAFGGDYGVYHSIYDDFYWMRHFGDPTFAYHVALSRVLGTLALRLDEADVLPFDYPAYASEIEHSATDLFTHDTHAADKDRLEPVLDAAAHLAVSASRASQALRVVSAEPLDPEKTDRINLALADVEQALLAPEGLAGRPWFKHTIYAPGSYAGYAAEVMPGVSESLGRNDPATLHLEADSLAGALLRASARLDDVARLAEEVASQPTTAPERPALLVPGGAR